MGKKMGASFSSISRWLWTGKNKQDVSLNKLSSPSECNLLGVSEPASVKLPTTASPLLKGTVMRLNIEEEVRIDREYDAVLVPSDGSKSGELDWSIGWLESFSPEFQSDDENDASYAVLVPSYRPGFMEGIGGPNMMFDIGVKGISCDYTAEGRKYMEQWLSSLQGR
ncbi:unnamed protein product [Rhodiola kirilowii]